MSKSTMIPFFAAILFAGSAVAQSLDEPLPGVGDFTPAQWVPQSLQESHEVSLESVTDGDMEIAITPRGDGASFNLRFLTGPAQQPAGEMIEFARSTAKEIGDVAAAEIFDLTFADSLPCFGSKDDNLIVCSFDGFALEFSSDEADYDTLREHADQMAPLQAMAESQRDS